MLMLNVYVARNLKNLLFWKKLHQYQIAEALAIVSISNDTLAYAITSCNHQRHHDKNQDCHKNVEKISSGLLKFLMKAHFQKGESLRLAELYEDLLCTLVEDVCYSSTILSCYTKCLLQIHHSKLLYQMFATDPPF